MKLSLINLYPRRRIHQRKWRRMIRLLALLMQRHADRWPKFRLSDLEVVFLDDRRIAALNRRYLRHRGPTDVMAFNLGSGVAEICLSLDTAGRQAKIYGQTAEQELTLYLVHGMLHLAGFDDALPRQRRRMQREELWLLQQLKRPR